MSEEERLKKLLAWIDGNGWQLDVSVMTPRGEHIDVANFTSWPLTLRLLDRPRETDERATE